MKKIIVFIFLIKFFHPLYSQQFVGLSYSKSHTGRNIHALWGKEYTKYSFQIGAKYLLNNEPGTNGNRSTVRSSYADNLIQHIGLSAQFRWKFNPKNWFITPSLFCNLQFTRAPIRNFYFRPEGGSKDILRKVPVYSGSYNNLEHGFGIRLDAPISTSPLSINAALGVNAAYMWGFQKPYIIGEPYAWEATPYFCSIGLNYQVIKEAPKKKLKK